MNSIVIVAGGKGLRMGGEIPKQFLLLRGKPVLMRTIEAFYQFDPSIEIILVLPVSHQSFWQELIIQHQFNIKHQVVTGGKERFHSVQNGVIAANGNIIGIHDGVRPLVSKETLQRTYSTAKEKGNAIPFIPIADSLRLLENNSNKMVDRSKFVRIQTPQVFKAELIKKAFEQTYDPNFTDDASVIEKAGHQVVLVEGNEENIKITRPVDLDIAGVLLG